MDFATWWKDIGEKSLGEEYKRIAKVIWKEALLHAAEQDKETASRFTMGSSQRTFLSSASHHEQAASEVK